ncbi:hypothetical protein Bca4012_073034 [Brassica carinata]
MTYRLSRSDKEKWTVDPRRPHKRPPVKIPATNTNALIEEHMFTLIGRVTNPSVQKTRALVDFFLQHWKVTGTISGRDLGPYLFQFKFDSEKDLQSILIGAPYHFKRWMIILQRWEPIVSDYFPALIPFWITIHGIPLHYWDEKTITTIGEALGPIDGKDVDHARIRVFINGLKPLEMKMDISLPSGEIKEVELQYEKLEKHCFSCFSLSHEVEECPSQRARSNQYGSRTSHLGISQRQTLERIDAGKRRLDSRKQNIYSAEPEQPHRGRSSSYNRDSEQAPNWSYDKDFCLHYGARRDPHFTERRSDLQTNGHGNPRPSARDRLSLPKDSSGSKKTGNLRLQGVSQRSEWRPVQEGSASRQSHVSHTPSPRPNRESMHSSGTRTCEDLHRSGDRNFPSNEKRSSERRSALERLSASKERIPLLLDGEANTVSGRLQGVTDHHQEDGRHRHSSGGSSNPSNSRAAGKAPMDQSPIRTLSEDRRHVSLRLGPMVDSEETIIEDIPLPRRSGLGNMKNLKAQGKKKSSTPSASRKISVKSPLHGISVKRRRTTKAQTTASARRRLLPPTGTEPENEAGPSRTARPKNNPTLATYKKGADFRTAPKPLP